MTAENEQQSWVVTPIATVSTSRSEAIDDDWGTVESTITLDASFNTRHQAVHGRVRAARNYAPTGVVARTDGVLLLTVDIHG